MARRWRGSRGGLISVAMWSFDPFEYPLLVLVGSMLALWLAALAGKYLRPLKSQATSEREQAVLILNAALTLAALLIGFSFALAAGRYDQRKSFEAAEANAIGTAYLRADLLPAPAAARVRVLLIAYTQQRIQFYETHDPARLQHVNADTARLQGDLWSTVAQAAGAQPTPTMAAVVIGMNDVLNTQHYTQAAWWYHIPTAAWVLMLAVAMSCGLLLGRVESQVHPFTLLLLPFILSIALFLIAEIDSPRHGLIQVPPQNLLALTEGFGSPPPSR